MGTIGRARSATRSVIFGDDSPYAIAMGAALGMFLALTPTMGIQMVVAVLFAWILRANKVIAVAMVWISNPLTILPLFYAYYVCGALLTSKTLWRFSDFANYYERMDGLPLSDAIREIGSEVGYPLVIGSMAIATISGLITYPVVYSLVMRIRRQGSGPTEDPKMDEDQQPTGLANKVAPNSSLTREPSEPGRSTSKAMSVEGASG